MTVYVDTSGLYAYLVRDDPDHGRAVAAFRSLHAADEDLLTTSYVLVESAALLQARVGVSSVRTLHEELLPLLEVVWVDADLHGAAAGALLAAGRRSFSLVDWVSFTVMAERRVSLAFAFDTDFADRGFVLVPEG